MSPSKQQEPNQLQRSVNGLPMKISLSTAVKRSSGDTSEVRATDLLEALAICEPQPATSARCLNPSCSNRCSWNGEKGRPKKFCSDTCRQKHETTRRRLEEEISIIDGVMDNPQTRPGQRKMLSSHRAQRAFELARYPDVRGPRTVSSPLVRTPR